MTLDDLLSTETRQQIEDTILAVAAAIGLDTTNWREGGKTRTLIASFSQKLSDLTVIGRVLVSTGFLDYATGNGLTILAEQVYGVDRLLATAGDCTLEITNGGVASSGPHAIGSLHFTNGAATYTNLAAVTIGASDTEPVLIGADEPGTASNAGVGTIDEFVTPIIGLTCSNTTALAGTDEELDAALRVRCRLKLAAISPAGAADAYRYVIQTTLPGTRAHIIEASSTGDVTIYLADPDGPLGGGDVTLIDTALREQVVPLTVSLATSAASAVTVAVTYSVWLPASAGYTSGQVQTAVSDAIAAFINGLPIGGYEIPPASGKVYRDALLAAISKALPEIFHVTVTVPAVDTSLAVNQVATVGAITPSVVLVS